MKNSTEAMLRTLTLFPVYNFRNFQHSYKNYIVKMHENELKQLAILKVLRHTP